MSTLAAHAALGLLLGLGMRVRPKLLPLVPIIALLPDLDHLDMLWAIPGLHTRMTFHNVFFVVFLPLAIYVGLATIEARDDLQDLAGKTPVILTGSIVTDLLSIEPRSPGKTGGEIALFYPVDRRWWTVPKAQAPILDPTAWGTVSAVLVFMSLLAVATWAWFRYVGGPGNAATVSDRRQKDGVYVLSWILLFPMLAGAGLVIPADVPPGPVDRTEGSRDRYRKAFLDGLYRSPPTLLETLPVGTPPILSSAVSLPDLSHPLGDAPRDLSPAPLGLPPDIGPLRVSQWTG